MNPRYLSALLLLGAAPLAAQTGPTRWAIERKTSLAWWQMDPHYEHLWATTCPADPSWQPGEGRDPGQYTDYSWRPKTIAAGRSDSRIPLFPRFRVRPLCRDAIRGEITATDAAALRGVKGTVTLIADSLFTGLEMRDKYARRAVLETMRYPEITFTIDSLVDVQRGDTTRATAVGTLTVHDNTKAIRAPVQAWQETAGLRVRAQFALPAASLTSDFHLPEWALGMGVGMRRWKTLHMGIDVILKPPT